MSVRVCVCVVRERGAAWDSWHIRPTRALGLSRISDAQPVALKTDKRERIISPRFSVTRKLLYIYNFIYIITFIIMLRIF